MAKSGNFFAEYEPHSRHKLLILEHYFERWGFKLGLREGAGNRLLYVDACAGAGQDDQKNPGSPLIAARAAAVASDAISKLRKERVQIEVVAIESDKKRHKQLKELLAPFGSSVRTHHGELADIIGDLERDYANVPTLYFIDPFGLKPLRAELVRRALTGAKNEALLLFAGQAALRHFGAIAAGNTRAERKLDKFDEDANQVSLFDDSAEREAKRSQLVEKATKSRASQELTRERAIPILNDAFGPDCPWLSVIEQTPQVERRDRFLALYLEQLRLWSAGYRLPIPILNSTGSQVYHLVHASHSPAGYATMKEAVEYALKYSDLPGGVCDLMEDEIRTDVERIADSVKYHFAGQTVRWAPDSADRSARCVKRYVLEHTAMYNIDAPALKQLLEPLRTESASIVYHFPSIES